MDPLEGENFSKSTKWTNPLECDKSSPQKWTSPIEGKTYPKIEKSTKNGWTP